MCMCVAQLHVLRVTSIPHHKLRLHDACDWLHVHLGKLTKNFPQGANTIKKKVFKYLKKKTKRIYWMLATYIKNKLWITVGIFLQRFIETQSAHAPKIHWINCHALPVLVHAPWMIHWITVMLLQCVMFLQWFSGLLSCCSNGSLYYCHVPLKGSLYHGHVPLKIHYI